MSHDVPMTNIREEQCGELIIVLSWSCLLLPDESIGCVNHFSWDASLFLSFSNNDGFFLFLASGRKVFLVN